MSDGFDPYLKWLGIPPKHQPPHHYRLLGLEAFESDPDAIENAADRQMAHLRTFRSGKRVALAEQLLSEIAEAKVCLLSPNRKSQYDAKLEAAEAKKNGDGHGPAATPLDDEAGDAPKRKFPLPPSAKPPVAVPVAMPVAAAAPPKPPVLAEPPSPSPLLVGAAHGATTVRHRKSTPWVAIAAIGAIVAGALAVAAIVGPMLLSTPVDVAAGDEAGKTIDAAPTVNDSRTSTRDHKTSRPAKIQPVVPPPAGGDKTDAGDAGERPTRNDRLDRPQRDRPRPPWRVPRQPRAETPPETENPPTETDTPDGGDEPADDGESDEGDQPLDNTAPLSGTEEDDGDDGDAPPATEIAERKLAPALDVQKNIETKVRQLYKLSAGSTPEEQGAIAQRLIADAAETRDSPDDQFVMLRVAAETAAARADLATAMQAVDALAASYEIEAVPLRLKLVEQASKATLPPAERAQAIQDALPVLDAALAENKFAEIDTLTTNLLAVTRRLNDRELSTALIERRKTALAMRKQYDKAVAALETLKANPDDPAANGIVGGFWAYVKNNWAKGLPYLAKGDDAAAADAAQRELAHSGDQAEPPTGDEIAKLADDWFALAEKQEPPAKYNVLRHAESLYQVASPQATGLTKTAVERQLAEIEKLLAAAGSSTQPVSRMARITASCDSSFELYINGEYVTRGDREEISEVDRELKSGDVLLAMGSNLRRERGFACVIKFAADGPTIVTGQAKAWYTYTPASTETWYDPRGVTGIGPPRLGDADRHTRIEQQTGIRSQSIWGNNQFRSFFVLQIP